MPRAGSSIIDPRLYDGLRGRLYAQEAWIERPSTTQSASGAMGQSGLTTIYRAIPGRLSSAAAGSRGGQITELRRPDGTSILAERIFDCAGRFEVKEIDQATIDGRTFDVMGVQHASADGRTRLYLQRREP